MDDGRRNGWAIFLAPLLLAGLAAAPARADLLVSRLNREPVALNQAAASCSVTEEQAQSEPTPQASVDENALALTVLATVLFSNPDNPPPQTGGGSTPTPSGGTTPPPPNDTPEPATLLSALLGTGLAGLYAAIRRKRLVKVDGMPAA